MLPIKFLIEKKWVFSEAFEADWKSRGKYKNNEGLEVHGT